MGIHDSDLLKHMQSMINQALAEIKTNMNEQFGKLTGKIESIEAGLSHVHNKVSELSNENETLKSEVQYLKISLNVLRQENLNRKMIIKGLGEIESEELPLRQLVLRCIEKIQPDFVDQHLLHASRMGKCIDGRTRLILVEFSHADARNTLLKLKKKKSLNAAEIEASGPESEQIIFNEFLTKTNMDLFQHARKLKQSGVKYVWIRDGLVKVRIEEKSEEIGIFSTGDVDELDRMINRKRRASKSPMCDDPPLEQQTEDINKSQDDEMNGSSSDALNAAPEIVSNVLDRAARRRNNSKKKPKNR